MIRNINDNYIGNKYNGITFQDSSQRKIADYFTDNFYLDKDS